MYCHFTQYDIRLARISLRMMCTCVKVTTKKKAIPCISVRRAMVISGDVVVVVVVVLFKVVPQTGVDAFFYTCRRLQN